MPLTLMVVHGLQRAVIQKDQSEHSSTVRSHRLLKKEMDQNTMAKDEDQGLVPQTLAENTYSAQREDARLTWDSWSTMSDPITGSRTTPTRAWTSLWFARDRVPLFGPANDDPVGHCNKGAYFSTLAGHGSICSMIRQATNVYRERCLVRQHLAYLSTTVAPTSKLTAATTLTSISWFTRGTPWQAVKSDSTDSTQFSN